jgi:acetylornithine deacetylase/succinyl-diaminopimelate desuccinylase-like protein
MITAEPTGGAVWNASRGALSMRITVRGTPAHVGLSHLGVNAFERAHAVVEALLRLKADVHARGSILLLGGQSGGGTNFNTVPGECWFTLDRRLNPDESLADERQRILDVLDPLRRSGIPIEVEIFQEGAPANVSTAAPLARALAASIEDVTGRRARFEPCPGLLETRFYCERGIDALAYGPGRLEVSHGPDEYVDLDEICRGAAVYALTALRVLR